MTDEQIRSDSRKLRSKPCWEGNIIGSGPIFRDITEHNRTEESHIQLLARAISGQEEERRRIARDLHDEAGQALTSLLVRLRLLKDARTLKTVRAQIDQLCQITAQTLDSLGRLVQGLHPTILDDLGLAAALTQYTTDYAQSYGITMEVIIRGLDSGPLRPPVEMALYRIVQEALTNIAKHAAAKIVRIVLERQPWEVHLIIADDGCSFNVETARQASPTLNHLGLKGMSERAALLGGSMTIESKPGAGTIIAVHIPLEDWESHRMDGARSVPPVSKTP
jgi:signal transduction histidine kinase